MRYYEIIITNPKTGAVIHPKSFAALGKSDSTYTSYVNGKNLGAALNVEIQASVYGYGVPRGGSFVRIWGISIDEISQSNNLNGMDIVVKAGMQKGLPLANPKQNGVIIAGTIFQAFGNWEGTAQTLDLLLIPNTGTAKSPKNFTFSWKAKTPLADAIKTTLESALPKFKQKIAISDKLVLNNDEKAVFASLKSFSDYIAKITTLKQFQGIKPLSGGTWIGVTIKIEDKQVVVFDGTKKYGASSYASPIQVKFEDLVGQPTWLSPTLLNFRCIMRADISVGDYVKLPDKLASPFVLTTGGASRDNTPARDKTAFSGVFVVREVYQFGNFRQADGQSWVTSFEAAFVKPPSTPAASDAAVEASNKQKIEDAFNAPTSGASDASITASNNQKIQDAFNAPTVPATPQGPLGQGGV